VLIAASALIVLGPAGGPGAGALVGLVAAGVIAVAAAVVALTRRHSRLPFSLTIAVAAVDVVLLVSAGASLVAR